jgi:hypothetical protein
MLGISANRCPASPLLQCHPLGIFEEIGSLSIATTPAELYNSVLVDTPLSEYFLDCISEQDLDEVGYCPIGCFGPRSRHHWACYAVMCFDPLHFMSRT